jgi:hypothetical protein
MQVRRGTADELSIECDNFGDLPILARRGLNPLNNQTSFCGSV